ncbi:MAG: hypothetical protein O3C34_08240 [Proteobacteria bacterium]|nr:hypothetical protein [Pseudomonadota bacterium]
MPQELDRFLALFDGLFISTNSWMTGTPKEKQDWVPFENPNMKFGDRISTITIRSVYIHTIVGEHSWARVLKDCEDGAVLKHDRERIVALTETLASSDDLLADAMKLHTDNMTLFRGYSDDQLEKKIKWSGREWTVMGFLWAIYSHRSYHLGNIDIFMRESDEAAPDFFSNFRDVMA